MIETITIGQIGIAIAFLVSLITGIGYLHKQLKTWIASSLSDQLTAIEKKIDELGKQLHDVDENACKNFLVARCAEAEKGVEWDEVVRERFWEQYEHYTTNGGNSYIKNKVEKLKNERKI